MSGLTGNIGSLKDFARRLRELPTVVAQKVAAEVAPALTEVARATFSAGEDAYGGTWTIREDGTRATLRKSGTLASHLHFVAIGTKVRVALGTAYAKYVVGKRPVFPRQGAPLPAAYVAELQRVTSEVCKRELGR